MTTQNDPHLEELTKIRKALEDIELILEYAHVPQKSVEIGHDEKGSLIHKSHYFENPLEHLREELYALRSQEKD